MVLRGRALRRLSVRSRPEARLSSIRSGGPVGEVFEEGEAGLDFLAGEVGEAVGGEGLASEGGDDGAVGDGTADVVEGEFCFPSRGKVSGEGTEEGIAGTGGVGDLGEREGGAAEEGNARERGKVGSGEGGIGEMLLIREQNRSELP